MSSWDDWLRVRDSHDVQGTPSFAHHRTDTRLQPMSREPRQTCAPLHPESIHDLLLACLPDPSGSGASVRVRLLTSR